MYLKGIPDIINTLALGKIIKLFDCSQWYPIHLNQYIVHNIYKICRIVLSSLCVLSPFD
ncbi:unnamed protein product [Larinioides sclopetarius]|uniref:Uncharacterized protein n=1 Tax=Larinioides sclopetarius TaxID=280406 RepID=A0AAV1Z774_9ARAC